MDLPIFSIVRKDFLISIIFGYIISYFVGRNKEQMLKNHNNELEIMKEQYENPIKLLQKI